MLYFSRWSELFHLVSRFQVANLYRGKMCGLCGDYNYDKHRELVGANGELYTNTLEFAKSYVVPSSDCTPPSRS